MTHSKDQQNAIAKTIISQLGGSRIMAMLGIRNFRVLESGGVEFSFKGSRKFNLCKVELDQGSDTYAMSVCKLSTSTFLISNEQAAEGLHAGDLTAFFTRTTGLHTRL